MFVGLVKCIAIILCMWYSHTAHNCSNNLYTRFARLTCCAEVLKEIY